MQTAIEFMPLVQRRISPALMALLTQIVALAIIFVSIISFSGLAFNLFEWSVLQGILAAIISYKARMALWWIPIHLAFVPLLILTLSLGLSPVWFCASFLLLALIYGKTYQTQVPLYLSSWEVSDTLISLLPKQRPFKFIDLGSGCGGLLSRLNQILPNGDYYGIEAAPIPCMLGKLRNLINRAACTIKWGDFWPHNLTKYDVVYAYLSPVPMEKLWQKACQEMQPGSLFISNTFIVQNVEPEKAIKLNDFSNSTLFVWRIPEKN